ncbi:hypothetical protein HYALB_00005115 [Hymenoscyphus albidus]|uniref:Uncharacterized protein n=1 Tax=Hymenoscyphus albidus TaxID=595503 RepID=A0A9N9Q670_9HELO|nr:hypothetical protein HYALB_00005115 [Hymenoscyphus albidus]
MLTELPSLTNLSTFNLSLPTTSPSISDIYATRSLAIIHTNITTMFMQFSGIIQYIWIESNSNLANLTLTFNTVGSLTISNVTHINFLGGSWVDANIRVSDRLDIPSCQEYTPSGFHVYQGFDYSIRDSSTTSPDVLPLPVDGELAITNDSRISNLKLRPSLYPNRSEPIHSGTINITNCPSLKSLEVFKEAPSPFDDMVSVGSMGSIRFTNCVSLNSVSLQDTKNIGGSFILSDCPVLNNISMPALQVISEDFNITNNSNLKTVSFPSLQTISGPSQIEGNFSDLQFPILERATKGFSINMTDNLFTCSTFDDFYSLHIRAPYTCSASKSTKNTAADAAPTPASDHKSSSLSTAAEVGIGISIGIPLLALFIGTAIFLQKRNKNNGVLPSVSREVELPQGGHHEIPELALSRPGAGLSQGGHHEMTEMAAISGPGELPAHPFEHDSPIIANQEAEHETEDVERERDADMRERRQRELQ